MDKQQNLFEEFPAPGKEQWIARIERDLRGKPFSDLQWQLEEEITVEPFYHPDDMPEMRPPLWDGRPSNSWEIGEVVEVADIAQANAELLEGLKNGVEAPLLVLRRNLNDEELERLLQGVEWPFISLHFTHVFPDKKPADLLQQLHRLAEQREYDTAALRGSIDFDPILDWANPPYDQLAESIRFCAENLPQFRMLQINGLRFHAGMEQTSRELGLIAAKGSEYLAQMQLRGIDPELTNRFSQFTVAVSTSFFVDIAKLRALKLIWANVLEAYGAREAGMPLIVAHLAQETQTDNVNTNMIKAGTQAMSAVIGGAGRLYVRPANAALKEPSSSFTRRMARNVQHLLRLESYLDRVVDPAAGSYYIERLTDQLAERAWAYFKELEQGGAFA